MARINFTAARIEDYKCDVGRQQSFLWDTASPCLALRATRADSKAYIFQARLHGKDIRITIGSPASWKISDARAEANRLKVMVDQGIDPREVAAELKAKSAAKAADKAAKRLLAREAWDAYLAAPHPKWGVTHRKDHLTASQQGNTIPKVGTALTRPGPLATLLCFPLHEITSEVVADWFKKECTARPTFTKNCLRKFRAFVNWCAEQQNYKIAVNGNCCTATVVRDIVPRSKTKAGDSLQREQLPLWFAHVRRISNPVFSAYLQGLLITGARRQEWALLKWADVDFQWNQMTIRDKVDGSRTIPLTPYLSALLQSMPHLNEYVFSSPTSREGYIVGVTKPHTQAVEKAGLPHVSLHGLRRSFTTLSEWLEIPSGVVAQIQGHKPSAVQEKHYTRRSIDLLRHHHVKIEKWMIAQAGIDFAEKAAA